MSFVATPQRKILIFRGIKTPEWLPDKVGYAIKEWDALIDKYIDTKIGKLENPSIETQILINRFVRDGWLRSMAQLYDLRVFACPFDENIAKYQDPAKPGFLRVDSAASLETL